MKMLNDVNENKTRKTQMKGHYIAYTIAYNHFNSLNILQ